MEQALNNKVVKVFLTSWHQAAFLRDLPRTNTVSIGTVWLWSKQRWMLLWSHPCSLHSPIPSGSCCPGHPICQLQWQMPSPQYGIISWGDLFDNKSTSCSLYLWVGICLSCLFKLGEETCLRKKEVLVGSLAFVICWFEWWRSVWRASIAIWILTTQPSFLHGCQTFFVIQKTLFTHSASPFFHC